MNNFTKVVSQKFLNTVNKFRMFENAETIIVGFSGGADSVCLLHLLNSFKDEFSFTVNAVHINHGIRGEEADSDQAFAKKICEDLGITFNAVSINCIKEAEITKESVEECGRRLRYQIFNSFCNCNCKIATAHNANDNAETIIFNMARGTTVKGLCGIPYVRDNIIRPVLECSRSEIEGYCRENNLSYVTDSTNLSDEYTRNMIRHQVLPVIEKVNPSFLSAFTSLSDSACCVTEYISDNAELLLQKAKTDENIYRKSFLLESHYSVCSEALYRAYYKFSDKTLDNSKVKALYNLLISGGRLQLHGENFAEVKKDYIRFYKVQKGSCLEESVIESYPFSFKFKENLITLEIFNNNSKIVNEIRYNNMINYDAVVGKLVLRTRKAGDKFTFGKRGITKSLKKLFTEENVPVELRDEIPVISDDVGVVWVYGFGVTKRCLPICECGNIVLVRGENNDR